MKPGTKVRVTDWSQHRENWGAEFDSRVAFWGLDLDGQFEFVGAGLGPSTVIVRQEDTMVEVSATAIEPWAAGCTCTQSFLVAGCKCGAVTPYAEVR